MSTDFDLLIMTTASSHTSAISRFCHFRESIRDIDYQTIEEHQSDEDVSQRPKTYSIGSTA